MYEKNSYLITAIKIVSFCELFYNMSLSHHEMLIRVKKFDTDGLLCYNLQFFTFAFVSIF